MDTEVPILNKHLYVNFNIMEMGKKLNIMTIYQNNY
jgi:hypothetical protein